MKNYKVLFLFLVISNFSFAEPRKDYVVNVSIENAPISQLFSLIENQLQVTFSYNTHLLNSDSLITYSGHTTVKKVISDIFEKRIQTKVIGSYIVLIEHKKNGKDSPHSNTIEFTGSVLNKETNKPLANVSIYEITSKQNVLTNTNGQFTLSLGKGHLNNFSIAKTNFTDTLISINLLDENTVTILLNPIISPISIHPKATNKALLNDDNFVDKLVPRARLISSKNLMIIDESSFFQASLIPYLGTNNEVSGITSNNISLNVIGGYNGSVNGFEVASLFNILSRDMHGIQIAGITNQVLGKTRGIQAAGLLNRCKKNVTGIQLAGVSNFLHDSLTGIQASGISNVVNGTVNGLQASGVHNFSAQQINGIQASTILNLGAKNLIGIQASGISNNIKGSTIGVQAAAIHNLTTKTVYGAQLSGIHNQTFGKLNGLQVSLINFAKVNNGLQIGLINVADSANGISLGLINYVVNGYHPLEISGNEVLYTNLAFKSGIDAFYTTWTAGFRPNEPDFFGFGFGVGSKINTWKWLSISLDLTTTFINEGKLNNTYNNNLNLLNRADLTFDFHIKKLSLFAGPAINLHVSELKNIANNQFVSNIALSPFFTRINNSTQIQSWVGFKYGFRYNF